MYEQAKPNQDLGTYSAGVVEKLLRDMAFSITKTLENPDQANVHDLRRLCLRLRHALRLFARLLPGKAARKIQKRLALLQDLLAGVRTTDVAARTLQLEVLAPSLSRPLSRKINALLAQERRRSQRPLRARLRKMQHSDAMGRWRIRLLAARAAG